jgi:hypothetical protein
MTNKELIKGIEENFIAKEVIKWQLYIKSKENGNETLNDIYIINENFEFILLKVWSNFNERFKQDLDSLKKELGPDFEYDETKPFPSNVYQIRIEIGNIDFKENNGDSSISTSIKRIYQVLGEDELQNYDTIITILKNRKSFL